jgi:hypothetical protein
MVSDQVQMGFHQMDTPVALDHHRVALVVEGIPPVLVVPEVLEARLVDGSLRVSNLLVVE